MGNKDARFLKSAFTLAIAGFVVKIIGAVYRIPLYSILGSEGMGLFQMAYPIYAILLTVSSAGLNVAISKAVAERWVLKKYGAAQTVFRVSLILMVVLGLAGSMLLYSMSGWIAENMARDPRARLSIAAISPALFMAVVLSAFRGWFQGIEEMGAPAVSQVLEQIGRLVTMYILARMLLPRGIEYAASGATFGAAVGAFTGILYIGIVYLALAGNWAHSNGEERDSWLGIAGEVMRIAIPVSLASAVFGITELIDLGLVPGRLQAAGIQPDEATRLFGQLSGGAFPFLNIPTIFTGALQAALVPSISGAAVLRDSESITRRVKKALSITVALALPAALGLYVLAEPVPALLLKDSGIGRILRPLTPAVVFLALQQVTSGILQGMGKLKAPLINLIWAALIKALLTYSLVGMPALGIVGASIATTCHFGVAAILNVLCIQRELGNPLDSESILKISLSSAIMSIAVSLAYVKVQTMGSWKLGTVIAIVVGIITYGVLIMVLGVITTGDLESLSFVGSFIKRFKRRRKKR
ncbi:MAG TPA: polysaccharide biosynthesis protein [Firmicutes bacterium]|jgi:stage V sporulation protein B|nr:polysaccharide biosynthesis protein [Bacillota bacterium]